MKSLLLPVLWIIIITIIAIIVDNRKSTNSKTNIVETPALNENSIKTPTKAEMEIPIKGVYQPKWLFSYNEKGAYYKLKEITDKHSLFLFAKVRLLDLVEPVKNNHKYKTYFYKVQAKHVDFVICNEKLVAKIIIELDDSSHDTVSRQERDRFVDEVLTSTGYRIIHTRAINKAEIEKVIQEIKERG